MHHLHPLRAPRAVSTARQIAVEVMVTRFRGGVHHVSAVSYARSFPAALPLTYGAIVRTVNLPSHHFLLAGFSQEALNQRCPGVGRKN
jgi:hypothetical protein